MVLANNYKLISIIICTFNRAKDLAVTLDALQKLDYPGIPYEIIVVDDGSIDNTIQIAGQYPVKYHRNHENSGIPFTRNMGLSLSKGDIIVFLDDDCIAQPDWLKEIVKCYEMPDVIAVAGMILAQDTKSIISNYMLSMGYGNPPLFFSSKNNSIITVFFNYINRYLNPIIGMKNETAFVHEVYGANCSFLQEKITAVKGYNEQLHQGEDIDLSYRLKKEFPDGEFIFTRKAIVRHKYETSFIKLLKKIIQISKSSFVLSKIYKSMFAPRCPIPVLYILAIIILAIFKPLFIALAFIILPFIFYFWWLQKLITKRKIYFLLFPYIQLCVEFLNLTIFIWMAIKSRVKRTK